MLKISGWSLFAIGILVLLGFANIEYSDKECSKANVSISKETGHDFVTEEAILSKLNDIGYTFEGQRMRDIEIDHIEKSIAQLPGVKSTEVYKFNDGTVNIEIEQRRPVARVISSDGLMSYYIDDEGGLMPLSEDYIAKVPVFNGSIHVSRIDEITVGEIEASDSLQKVYVLEDIYKVAMQLDKNEFMSSQVVQVYVNPKKEFEMIPRVGNHRILFGGSNDAELKFRKLEKFYTEVIEPKELNLYDTLNIKYKNQIICSKR